MLAPVIRLTFEYSTQYFQKNVAYTVQALPKISKCRIFRRVLFFPSDEWEAWY